jgi:stringent starvation protein B
MDKQVQMISNKPYLIRAFYDWIVDSQCTPYVVINALYPRCIVPESFIENGEITLNVSPTAVRDLKISNETLEFRASFSGVVHIISAPVKAILAIFAQENQEGMFFDYEEEETTSAGGWAQAPQNQSMTPDAISNANEKKRPSHLRLID